MLQIFESTEVRSKMRSQAGSSLNEIAGLPDEKLGCFQIDQRSFESLQSSVDRE